MLGEFLCIMCFSTVIRVFIGSFFCCSALFRCFLRKFMCIFIFLDLRMRMWFLFCLGL